MAAAVAGSAGVPDGCAANAAITRSVTAGSSRPGPGDRTDRVDQLLRRGDLEQEAAHAGAQQGRHVLVLLHYANMVTGAGLLVLPLLVRGVRGRLTLVGALLFAPLAVAGVRAIRRERLA